MLNFVLDWKEESTSVEGVKGPNVVRTLVSHSGFEVFTDKNYLLIFSFTQTPGSQQTNGTNEKVLT